MISLERIRERKLFQWAAAYLAGAWALLQVVDLVGNQFSWPGVLLRSITVLIAVGFLAVLVLAWYHGEQGRQQVSGPELLMLAGVLAIAGAALTQVSRSATPSVETTAATAVLPAVREEVSAARSIAVLPFSNLSADPENEYFSDGITEDILTHLSKIGDLRVISRTSIMRYKETEKSAPEIAEELGVVHILEGSVRRAGDRVRIVAQLIDARNDQHLWAETYDRDLKDIFQIQSEIAQKIAAALQAELSPAERRRIEVQPTENLAAYNLYLQGRAYYHRFQKEANETAIQDFKHSIQLDPTFALAWAGLADAYGARVNPFGEPLTWADSALAAAQRAIALDPELAEGHEALGTAYLLRGRYRQAIESLERAIALNPNYWPAISTMGTLKFFVGQYDEALRWHRNALSGDPIARAATLAGIAITHAMLGQFSEAEQTLSQVLSLQPDLQVAQRAAIWISLLQGKYPEAAQHGEKLVAGNPTDANTWAAAGHAYLLGGSHDRAREYLNRAYTISSNSFSLGHHVAMLLAYTLWRAGERDRAQKLFEEYRSFVRSELKKGNESWWLRYSLAAMHAIQHQKAGAYRWLQEAQRFGWTDYYVAQRDPLLENLHGDAEFRQLLAKQRTSIARMRQRVEREGW